ncbi:unnamed protein product [Calicophoron daubneyi]|uniref:Major facilitator superfamily (MFS) profile domain-containing protein n=1 Tax=Calicophoron daubneyi TaxID=300641 RepID=A0AAV2TYC9_CALDB
MDSLSMVYLVAYVPLIVPATWLLEKYGLRVTTIIGSVMNAAGGWIKCVAGILAESPAMAQTTRNAAAFPLLLFGQTIDAIAQIFLLGIPAHLASTWFGTSEVSTATAIGVLANQLGVGIGFCIPPIIVPAPPAPENGSVITANLNSTLAGELQSYAFIKKCMMILLYAGAACNTLPIILVLLLFRAQPITAPSVAQHLRNEAKAREKRSRESLQDQEKFVDILSRDIWLEHGQNSSEPDSSPSSPSREQTEQNDGPDVQTTVTTAIIFDPNEVDWSVDGSADHLRNRNLPEAAITMHTRSGGFKGSLMRVIKNPSFMLLLCSYGINTGTYYALGTLLNLILLQFFPADAPIGWVGFLLIISGIIGSIIGGIVLDKSKKYKLVIIVMYLMGLLWMGVFTGCLYRHSIVLIFVCSFFLGFFMTGFLPIGFEFAAELTYPESEGLTSGLLNASAQTFGIIFTILASQLTTNHGSLAGNLFLCAVLIAGFVLLVTVQKPNEQDVNLEQTAACTLHPDDHTISSREGSLTVSIPDRV